MEPTPSANKANPPSITGALDPNVILTAEFEYIAQAAFQNTEDRARVASYYLVTAGSLVAAILGAQVTQLSILPVHLAFALLFLVLSANGLLTVLELVRLRQSWYECARAMDQIKDYYTSSFPDLKPAFLWKTSTLPSRYKAWSVSYMLAVQVAGLSAGALAAAVAFAGISFNFSWGWLAGLAGVGYFILQLALYRQRLQTK